MIARIITALFMLFAPSALAQDAVRLVYIGIEDDPFYEPQPSYTGLTLKDVQRPVAGARVAMRGTRILGRALGLSVELEEYLLAPDDDAANAVRVARQNGAVAVLLDLPEEEMERALAEPGQGGVLFNIRHRGARWRDAFCDAGLLHTIPSHAMEADAMAQHLRAQNWGRVLLLKGGLPSDDERAEVVKRSAAKYGLTIVAERRFELTNDPRKRDLSNIALLTNAGRHDVIWVIDKEGEFGRYVPYATYAARPVVGDEGLRPHAWHWTYERHGAPQLNQRFRRDNNRNMTSEDWAAWIAVRAVIESISRVAGADAAKIAQYLRSDKISLDLYKGVPGSFREWNGQLRQPILLATHNAVINRAPIEGFEHRTDTLDTLGFDREERRCPD